MKTEVLLKQKIILLSYGKGGHQEQMRRLLEQLDAELSNDVSFFVLTDSSKPIKATGSKKIIEQHVYEEARDKHSTLKTLITLPKLFLTQIRDFFSIKKRYDVQGIITTGPGVSLLPAFLCRAFGIKVIAFESWSRFHTQSYTGKLLYKIADLFFIQNESLRKFYPKAIYRGRL